MVREQVRERRIVTRLLATRVSPSDGGQSGGTGLGTTVTTSALQDWSSTEMKLNRAWSGRIKDVAETANIRCCSPVHRQRDLRWDFISGASPYSGSRIQGIDR